MEDVGSQKAGEPDHWNRCLVFGVWVQVSSRSADCHTQLRVAITGWLFWRNPRLVLQNSGARAVTERTMAQAATMTREVVAGTPCEEWLTGWLGWL